MNQSALSGASLGGGAGTSVAKVAPKKRKPVVIRATAPDGQVYRMTWQGAGEPTDADIESAFQNMRSAHEKAQSSFGGADSKGAVARKETDTEFADRISKGVTPKRGSTYKADPGADLSQSNVIGNTNKLVRKINDAFTDNPVTTAVASVERALLPGNSVFGKKGMAGQGAGFLGQGVANIPDVIGDVISQTSPDITPEQRLRSALNIILKGTPAVPMAAGAAVKGGVKLAKAAAKKVIPTIAEDAINAGARAMGPDSVRGPAQFDLPAHRANAPDMPTNPQNVGTSPVGEAVSGTLPTSPGTTSKGAESLLTNAERQAIYKQRDNPEALKSLIEYYTPHANDPKAAEIIRIANETMQGDAFKAARGQGDNLEEVLRQSIENAQAAKRGATVVDPLDAELDAIRQRLKAKYAEPEPTPAPVTVPEPVAAPTTFTPRELSGYDQGTVPNLREGLNEVPEPVTPKPVPAKKAVPVKATKPVPVKAAAPEPAPVAKLTTPEQSPSAIIRESHTPPTTRAPKPKGAKVSPRTGMTAAQEVELGQGLRDIVAKDEYPATVDITGDGSFTVNNPSQAANLHLEVTKADIPGMKGYKTKGESRPTGERFRMTTNQGDYDNLVKQYGTIDNALKELEDYRKYADGLPITATAKRQIDDFIDVAYQLKEEESQINAALNAPEPVATTVGKAEYGSKYVAKYTDHSGYERVVTAATKTDAIRLAEQGLRQARTKWLDLRSRAKAPTKLQAINSEIDALKAAQDAKNAKRPTPRKGGRSGAWQRVDAEDWELAGKLAVLYVKKGVATIEEFTTNLVRDLGDAIRPHIQDLWDAHGPKAKEAEPTGSGTTPPTKPPTAKAEGGAADTLLKVLNAPKALKSSLDISAPGRQGLILSLTKPGKATVAFGRQMKALASEKYALARDAKLKAMPEQAVRDKAGLYLADMDGAAVNVQEEALIGGIGGTKWTRANPFRRSEHAYATYLNELRASSFDAMAKWLGADATDADLKAIANYVNVTTGRGGASLNPLGFEKATPFLNNAMFSPRLVASRFEYLLGQPIAKFGGKKQPISMKTRALIIAEYAKFASAMGTLYGLSTLAGGKVGSESTASEFGKVRVGDTRIDFAAGLVQPLVFMNRIIRGKYTSSAGNVTEFGKQPGDPGYRFGSMTATDTIAQFARSKSSPTVGTAWSLADRKDFMGKPYNLKRALVDLTVPITMSDIAEELTRQGGWDKESSMVLLNLIGIGVQRYDQTGDEKQKAKMDRN